MTEILLRAATRISADPGYFGCIGDDAQYGQWAWMVPESRWTPLNERIEVPDDQLLPCPLDVPKDQLLALLSCWPAWQVTEWARLEIGSSVLILGVDELAERVARLCRWRGALWRAIWGNAQLGSGAEHSIQIRRGQHADEVLRALPGQPDSVIVFAAGVEELRVTLALCRAGGTVVLVAPPAERVDLNLYPDVHRRGLSIRLGSPFEYGPADAKSWRRAAGRMDTLISAGLLALCAK